MSAVSLTLPDLTRARWALAAPRYELIPIKGMLEQSTALPEGALVTVTCSPKHGLERTLESAEWLLGRGFRVVPHIAARLIRNRAHLRSVLQRVREGGMGEVFLVGGDAPHPVGDFSNGLDVLRMMATLEERPVSVGVPAYPEGHATIKAQALQQALLEKSTLADYMVTQLCFDAAPIKQWLHGARAAGVDLPVYIGITGAVEAKRLMRIAMQIGLGASSRLIRRQGGMVGRLLSSSNYTPDPLIWDFVEAFNDPALAVRGLHINTFNNVAPTIAWRDALLADMEARMPAAPELAGAAEPSLMHHAGA